MHAKLSSSGSPRWSICTAAPGEEEGLPDTSSEAAEWGTACHLIASTCLTLGTDPLEHIGSVRVDEKEITVDDEMRGCAKTYVNYVRSHGGELHVEVTLPIDHITGEDGATGTADAVVLTPGRLDVIDLKGGMHQVDAEGNPQLIMYAAAALREFDQFDEVDTLRMVIVQPRLNHIDEWTLTVAELREEVAKLSAAAEQTRVDPKYAPGEKTCQWCKAKATCSALREYAVQELFPAEAVTVDIGALYAKVPLIRTWCDAIEEQVRINLTEGKPVTGFKLVEGRLSNREWKDPVAAEAMLREFRVPDKDMYAKSVLSPTQVEKLAEKKVLGPRQWKAMQEQIAERKPGKPQIVPESSSKPSLASVDDLF